MREAETIDVEGIARYAIEHRMVIDAVPESLTVEWGEYGASYFFREICDGSTLLWVAIVQDTFGTVIDDPDWTVDDPGTIYLDEDEYEDARESPFDMQKMQEAADEALKNYRLVCERVHLLKTGQSQR